MSHGHAEVLTTHEVHHDEHGAHHHQQSFISKYVFSQDHKIIAKQFLITGMIWAIIGGLMSVLFRLQLGYPDQTFPWLEDILGNWAKGGKITAENYYALGNHARYHSGILRVNRWLEVVRSLTSSFLCRWAPAIWLLQ